MNTNVQTFYRNGGPRQKPFSWSFSRLKNFEACPKKYYEVDVAKRHQEPEGSNPAMAWGNYFHATAARYITGGISTLPDDMKDNQEMLDRLRNAKGTVDVELKLAITKDMQPCKYFDKAVDPWYRCIVDVLVTNGPVAYAGDYKTGAIKPESVQLGLTAACIFAHFPHILKIRTEYIWIKEDAISREDYEPAQMPRFWGELLPRVNLLQHAHATDEFPARKNGLCRNHCPVKSCPHNGG